MEGVQKDSIGGLSGRGESANTDITTWRVLGTSREVSIEAAKNCQPVSDGWHFSAGE